MVAALSAICTIVFSVFVYRQSHAVADKVVDDTANNLMARSVEMFMVSTRKYHEQYVAAKTDEERKRITEDWNRSIIAVDEAVIHDFGQGENRVRLIGDEAAFGFKPLGGDIIRPKIPFEFDAAKALRGGAESFRRVEDDTLRIAVPLYSSVHAGCAECHGVPVSGKTLLGSLNTYIPLTKRKAEANANAWTAIGMVAGIFTILTVLVGWLITRNVVRPIRQVSLKLGAGAAEVAGSAAEMNGSSQSLAHGASEQAAALEETSSSLEQLSTQTQNNAHSAQQAAGLSAEAKSAADKGNAAMQKMSSAINEIQKSASETAKIIKVIDEIAFQTNLLALNAAVEAARAGEAGKGFAVVAEEVRNLAMRSAEAARNTSSMIEESVASARNGVAISVEVAENLGEITAAATKVSALISQISTASQEQAQGIQQVNGAVAQMDNVTQTTAAGAEETAASSKMLADQAQQMKSAVEELLTIVDGATGGRPGTPAASGRPAMAMPARA